VKNPQNKYGVAAYGRCVVDIAEIADAAYGRDGTQSAMS